MFRNKAAQSSVSALLLCGLWFPQAAPAAAGWNPQSDNKPAATETSNSGSHPVLVELFTSEGCSSCPPADALLERMDTSQPVAGDELIVLSEHVDYWDHDGWKDPNSSPALTERQVEYVHALKLKEPYTPQIIVDGTTELPANDQQQARKVFQEATTEPAIPVSIGEISVDAGNPAVLRARVEADGSSVQHNAEVYVAVALNHVESQVLRGENGGRHLTHTAVVVQLNKIGKLQKGKSFGENVELKLKPGIDPKNVRIVAFVQEQGPGRVLGAALRK